MGTERSLNYGLVNHPSTSSGFSSKYRIARLIRSAIEQSSLNANFRTLFLSDASNLIKNSAFFFIIISLTISKRYDIIVSYQLH